MAIFHEHLQYHPDTVEKHKITDKEIKFLSDLQHELNTQDHVGQADPRFWVIMGKEKCIVPEGYEDGVTLIDNEKLLIILMMQLYFLIRNLKKTVILGLFQKNMMDIMLHQKKIMIMRNV